MLDRVTISVVLPAYNEAAGIGAVVSSIPDFVDEIVVVDNNSKDATAEVARAAGARVVSETAQGYGNALKAGFRAATSDVVVSMDADGTYPVDEIERLVQLLESRGLDFLSGARFPLKDKTAMRSRNVFGNMVLNFCFGILFGKLLTDSQTGMWVMHRNKLALFDLRGESWEFSSEIKIEAIINPNVKFGEEHIHYAPRVGQSHFHGWSAAVMVGVRDIGFLVRRRFRRRPIPYSEPLFLAPPAPVVDNPVVGEEVP